MNPPSRERPNEPIAVIGSGCRFPGGANTPAQLWDLLQQPRDVQSPIPADRFSPDGFYHPSHDHQGTSHTRHGYFLSDDHRHFDAEFFGIKPVEANSMDPQQRLLLEVVYESIESAGLKFESLRGSSTAVYVGLMAVDYADMLNRDTSDYPSYVAAGTARSMISNRVSYFFDWRGPSMTIDTACSSSLVAVHLAIQSLRAGESQLAIAAGANLLLGPEQFIAGSHMKMLSPNGRSFWCDDRANGYARGEGIAAIVLKTLSAAIADGDDIECVIAETGLNQDGRTQGLTVPSAAAQASLIQATYRKAGLDLAKLSDRPQYFEAHGTGTPTGDPIEVQAIQDAFFTNLEPGDTEDQLYCGSIKTIIGHTEGSAGLAGLIKTSLALRHGIIPPNLLFKNLAPAVKPFYSNLKIPTTAGPWPTLTPGSVRRASVNSFVSALKNDKGGLTHRLQGFGGANAHCILESYSPAKRKRTTTRVLHLPFVFSATSEKSLVALLKSYSDHLFIQPTIDLQALSHTLCTRRTVFSSRVAVSANSATDLRKKLSSLAGTKLILTAPTPASSPRILGIFTGQGAQWAGMASQLMRYPAVVAIIDKLERSLALLPDPPSWSLKAELSAEKSCSRITEAAIAQPACTAVQILLVKMLHAAGVRFSAIVGHSSGEIAAAYAAGYLSAQDAIRIAYYRGVHLPLVGGRNGETGAMIAIGASYDEAQTICNRDEFRGRICIAASNSASSVTLSGDTAAIRGVQTLFESSNRFARLLRVDNAYHSHHMIRCSEAITASLRACRIKSQRPTIPNSVWISSVYRRDITRVTDSLDGHYWHSNTVGEVLFSQALETALRKSHFDIAVEVGAHPALKGPALQVIEDTIGHIIPYTGMLSRNVEDDEVFLNGLGYIWANLAKSNVDFAGYDRFLDACDQPMLLKGLPAYPWDHQRAFWHESRLSRAYRHRSGRHELLGLKNADCSEDHLSWRNCLVPDNLLWVSDHRIQGQTVFPGAAYIASAFEAARETAAERPVKVIELTSFVFGQPLVFVAGDSRVDVLISLNDIRRRKSSTTARFTYHSIANRESGPMNLNAHCQLNIVYGNQGEEEKLRPLPETDFGMREVQSERIYESFAQCGYQYTGIFRALSSVARKLGVATGLVRLPGPTTDTPLLIHPGTLDAAIHSILVAHSHPGDGRLSSPLLPTAVSKISINVPAALRSSSNQQLKFVSFSRDNGKRAEGNMDLSSVDGADIILRLQGLRTKPMAPATAANDIHMFSETVWGPAYPLSQGDIVACDTLRMCSEENFQLMAAASEQISHRYPAMEILGVGARTPDDSVRFLSGLDDALASYTHTCISDNDLNQARMMLDAQGDKILYKTLEPEMDVIDQGFAKHSYDLVVAFSIPPKATKLELTLMNIRRLLKPGGYFLCPQPIGFDQMTRQLPETSSTEPCVRGDCEQLSSSSAVLAQRKQMLETYGFADIVPPSQRRDDSSHRSHVTLIQAIDDRIRFLREPLMQAVGESGFSAGDITLVGGETLATSVCVSDIWKTLQAYSDKLYQAKSVSFLLDAKLPLGGSVLLLQDHDRPLFEDLNEKSLKGLQKLFEVSRNVLWVTHGYKHNMQHTRMLVAFARCLVQEMSHVRLQILDLPSSDALDASLILQYLFRLLGTGKWEEKGLLSDILWSTEPEVSYVEGCSFIPRVKLNKSLNDRYNSVRRTITRSINPCYMTVAIAAEDGTYVLREKIEVMQSPIRTNTVTIRVTHSFLKAVKVERCGFFYLLLGVDVKTNEQVIALSGALCSTVDVPGELVRSCSMPTAKAIEHLRDVFCGLVSCTILCGLASDDSVLVLDSDTDIATILSAFAAAQGIRAMFSTAVEDRDTGMQTPLRASGREIDAALPEINLSRVVCWKDDDWITKALVRIPTSVSFNGLGAYVAVKSSPVTSLSTPRASAVLNRVQDRLDSTVATTECKTATILPLVDVDGSSSDVNPMTMVEWTTNSKVPIRIGPVDRAELFGSDKTYWLAGLTGSLGLSLCQWMISRGARYIALSSRNPKVDPAWLAHVNKLGATVEICTGDITDYQSVESTLRRIRASMPPVAGVCHGAMVLQDALVIDLDMTRVEEVLEPKVSGAVNLDRIFRNHELNFFIMLSSIAAVTGNPGQSVYAAANGFLAGLAAQRRARGECASTVNVGAIIGTGATSGLTFAQQKSLQKAGVMWTSEQDFHCAFAEAVVASLPSDSSGEFTTGVRVCHTDEVFSLPKHASSPIFSHMLLQRNTFKQTTAVGLSVESVRAQLLRAANEEKVFQILAEFVTSRLRKALQLSPDSNVIDNTAEKLGIDSLIAVEMRSWFLKELGVDLPLLIIIGGSNMRHVVEICRTLLDPAMMPVMRTNATTSSATGAQLAQDDSEMTVSYDVHAQVSAALAEDTRVERSPYYDRRILVPEGECSSATGCGKNDGDGLSLGSVLKGGVVNISSVPSLQAGTQRRGLLSRIAQSRTFAKFRKQLIR